MNSTTLEHPLYAAFQNSPSGDFNQDDILFSTDELADSVFLLTSGKVKLSQKLGDEEMIARIATPGDLIGHRSLFSEGNFRATATAISEGTAYKISKTEFIEYLKSSPDEMLFFVNALIKDIEQAEKRIQQFKFFNIRQRLAHLLVLLSQTCGRNENDQLIIDLNLSRKELASMVPAATENTVRILSEFKKNKLIEEKRGVLIVLDLPGLEKECSY